MCTKEKSRDCAGPRSAVAGWVFLGITIAVFLFSILLLVGIGVASGMGHTDALGRLLDKGVMLGGPMVALVFCVASFRQARRAGRRVLRVVSIVALVALLAYLVWLLSIMTGFWFWVAFNAGLCAVSLVVHPLAVHDPQRVPAWIVHAVTGTILCVGGLYVFILVADRRWGKMWDEAPGFTLLLLATIGLAVLSCCSWFVYLKRQRATRVG